jgi:hypothetical protein
MAKEIQPRLVFERLFGSGRQEDESQSRRNLYRKSILDLVGADAQRLRSQVGQGDRRKLDEYFSSVRELEQRIERAEVEAKQQRPDFDVPREIPRELQQHIRLMCDLLVLAFRTDTTRIATLMLANDGSNRSYSMVGVNEGHHELSHHQDREEPIGKLKKIDRFLAGELGYFVGQLEAVPEGDGNLLDNSLVVYGSGLSDGNRHWHHDLPIVLAGHGGGTIRTGRHVRMPGETPLNNLFLSLLDRVGAGVDELGDSSGRLTVIDA